MKKIEISQIINDYIKMRGRTREEVADLIGVNYKTFSGQLIRNKIQAEELFSIARVLEIDLNWMATAVSPAAGNYGINSRQIPRMSPDYRNEMKPGVLSFMNSLIVQTPTSISSVRKALLSTYNSFFLLDVLLPETEQIYVQAMRDNSVRYYVTDNSIQGLKVRSMGSQQRIVSLIDEREAINRIIAERMENK